MSADTTLPTPPSRHPAPQRHRVGALALGFALFAAPAAWFAQLSIGSGLASHACYPRATPLAMPLWGGLWSLLLFISLVAIAISAAAGLVALRSWRATRNEQPGSRHHLLEVGEGRTRFLAMCGLLTSGGFLVALLFSTVMLFLVPVCNG